MSNKQKILVPLVFLSPGLIVFLVGFVYLMGYEFYLSFHSYSLAALNKGMKFVGLGNYIEALNNPHLWHSLKVSFTYSFSTVFLELVVGLGFALLLNRKFKGRSSSRAIVLLPVIFTPILVGLMWQFMLRYNGIMNYFLQLMGINKVVWFSSNVALFTIILVSVWQNFPFAFLILLSSLQTIPPELVEAAEIDGSSSLQKFRYVIFPMLRPAMLIILVIRTMDSLRVFDRIFILTEGGPARSTETLAFSVYVEAFRFFRLGYASALSFLLLIFVVVFVVLYVRVI